MKRTGNTGLSAVAGLLVVSVTPQVSAQEQDQGSALEEVIVSAQRTEANAQDTPVAMSIYSAEDLIDRGIVDIGSLAKYDPALKITGSTTTFIALRGVSSTNVTENGDPAVPISFDQFYTNRPFGQYGALYDIERVEVLRGPQGTLFGRNVVGGVINAYTVKPTERFEAGGSLEVGNYNALNTQGMINVPLSSSVRMRLSAATNYHEGYRRLEPVQLRGDDQDSKSARAQLTYEPNDRFKINALVQAMQIGGSGPVLAQYNYTYYQADGTSTGSPTCVLSGCAPDHVTPGNALSDTDVIQARLGNILDLNDFQARITADLRLGDDYTLTYQGGYDTLDWFTYVEVSRRDGSVSGRTPAGMTGPDWYRQHQEPVTINHELRIASGQDGRFSWQGGLFYFDEDNALLSERIDSPRTSAQRIWLRFDFPEVTAKSKAVYAQANFNVTDDFKLSVGGRYNKDEKAKYGGTLINVNGLADTARANPDTKIGAMSNTETTWHVGADWKLGPDQLVYAKADKGYKAGGYNNVALPYGPEQLLAYEVGFKSTFGGRFQFNAAAFFNDYTDQQIALLGPDVTLGTQTYNAGKSQIKGLELDIEALLGESTRAGLHASFLDGEYKEFSLINGSSTCPYAVNPRTGLAQTPNTQPNCNVDNAGNDTIQTPHVALTANLEHTFQAAGGSFTPSLDVRYTSKTYMSPFAYESSAVDPFTIVDAGLAYRPADGNWDLNFFVRNLTDEIYFVDFAEQQTSGIETYQYAYSAPRTYGVRVTFKID